MPQFLNTVLNFSLDASAGGLEDFVQFAARSSGALTAMRAKPASLEETGPVVLPGGSWPVGAFTEQQSADVTLQSVPLAVACSHSPCFSGTGGQHS